MIKFVLIYMKKKKEVINIIILYVYIIHKLTEKKITYY